MSNYESTKAGVSRQEITIESTKSGSTRYVFVMTIINPQSIYCVYGAWQAEDDNHLLLQLLQPPTPEPLVSKGVGGGGRLLHLLPLPQLSHPPISTLPSPHMHQSYFILHYPVLPTSIRHSSTNGCESSGYKRCLASRSHVLSTIWVRLYILWMLQYFWCTI